MDQQQQLFTISEVSQRTGYSALYLRDLCRGGALNPQRTGQGVRLFTQADIDQLLKRRRASERTRKQRAGAFGRRVG